MEQEVVNKLKVFADVVAVRFSHEDRPGNPPGEVFTAEKIIPMSENTAAVILRRKSGKAAICFFYYLKRNKGEWNYFMPTDSHILGMHAFPALKMDVEIENFRKK